MMKADALKARVETVRQQLRERRAGCLLVTNEANVSYLTGFSGDDSWAIVAARAVYLITDSRYAEQASGECPACRIVERKSPMAEAAGNIIGKLKIENAAVEKSISLAAYEAVKKHVKGLRAISGLVENIRMHKTAEEIAAIRKASDKAAKALETLRKYVRTEISESGLAGALDFEMRKLGAKTGFETIVAFGANASRPHHQPGHRKLRNNDTVLIDFGARYNGYCCDITRCFSVGKASRSYERAYSAVEEAQAVAISKVQAGAKLANVDAAAKNVIRDYGLPVYGHGTGHGLGLEVHEAPYVSAKQKGTLEAGHVITIEPGVYMPGKLGVRIEDDILVTETGCQVLTDGCPHKPW